MLRRARNLDLTDIQGNILTGYGNSFGNGSYWFVKLGDDPVQARRFVRILADRVTTAAPWGRGGKPMSTLNVAITATGLARLGVPAPIRSGFSEEFRAGMAARAEDLGDVNWSDPCSWELSLQDPELLVTVFAQDPDVLDHANGLLREDIGEVGSLEAAPPVGAELLHKAALVVESEAHKFKGREHFGFADGFSQPAVRGAIKGPARTGMGTPMRFRRWNLVAPGEFVLGYPGEDGLLPPAPPDPLGTNGSYMVVRKLAQDVGAFHSYLSQAALTWPGLPPSHKATYQAICEAREREVAGKIVGRWPDGRSLVVDSDPVGVGLIDEMRPKRINNFRYQRKDPEGARCPLGAHVRRANPRDSMGFNGQLTRRHRIIRRSMPYGEPWSKDEPVDEQKDRGLMFVCFQASIKRQFEIVQGRWLNDGDSFWLRHDKDLLTQGGGRMMLQGKPGPHGRPPRFLPPPHQPFVTTRGGGYFFMPGVTALRALGSAYWR
jgi:Dyp-type peroxidase family